MKEHLRLRCSLRCAPVAPICLGQSPCTRAIMLNSAPLPKPAAQDPRQRVPRRLIASSRVRSARLIQHNSVLCTQTRRLSRGSRNDQFEASFAAEPCANSPPHPSRQRACQCAVCSESRGRCFGMNGDCLNTKATRERPTLRRTSHRYENQYSTALRVHAD